MIKRKKSNRKNPANFDNEKGIGRSKYHSSKQYDSVEVLMKPSIFLKLAFPLDIYEAKHKFEFIENHINNNLPIAVPFLMINKYDDNLNEFIIYGHEGRHRTTIIKRKFGDMPSKVLLIFENFKINNKLLNEINSGILNEDDRYVEGPLFEVI